MRFRILRRRIVPKRKSPEDNSVSLIGWLFADVLVVLFVVALGGTGRAALPHPETNSSETAKTKRIVGLNPTPIDLRMDIPRNLHDTELARQQFLASTRSSSLLEAIRRGDTAGLVLTAAGPLNSCAYGQIGTSQTLNRLLRLSYPTLITSRTVLKEFKQQGCSERGKADVHIYLYTTIQDSARTR